MTTTRMGAFLHKKNKGHLEKTWILMETGFTPDASSELLLLAKPNTSSGLAAEPFFPRPRPRSRPRPLPRPLVLAFCLPPSTQDHIQRAWVNSNCTSCSIGDLLQPVPQEPAAVHITEMGLWHSWINWRMRYSRRAALSGGRSPCCFVARLPLPRLRGGTCALGSTASMAASSSSSDSDLSPNTPSCCCSAHNAKPHTERNVQYITMA